MAATFTQTPQGQTTGGRRRIKWGKAVGAGGSTGGDIDLGSAHVEFLITTPKAAAKLATCTVVNESLPANVKPTVVTSADETLYYLAVVM